MTTLRILVLYWHDTQRPMRAAVHAHLHMLDHMPKPAQILYFNYRERLPRWLRHFKFDVILLHTTFLCLRWSHSFPQHQKKLSWLANLDAIKIAFPQDEYDHSAILDHWLCQLGVTLIYSNFSAEHRPLLYPTMQHRATFHHALTGYIDQSAICGIACAASSANARPIHICYRASHLPYWFGSTGQLKAQIAEIVHLHAGRRGLACDISTRTADAILGPAWYAFLASANIVIGCESGSSVLDPYGDIKDRILALQYRKPTISFQELSQFMPPDWDSNRFHAISPRHFEAVLTNTCQLLVNGHYDGVLLPDRHYISLNRDFSNIEEALDKTLDHLLTAKLRRQAYDDIVKSGRYSYATLAGRVLTDIRMEQQRRCRQLTSILQKRNYTLLRIAIGLHVSATSVRQALFSKPMAILRRSAQVTNYAVRTLQAMTCVPGLRRIIWTHLTRYPDNGLKGTPSLVRDIMRLLAFSRLYHVFASRGGPPYVSVDYCRLTQTLYLECQDRRPANRPAITGADLKEGGVRAITMICTTQAAQCIEASCPIPRFFAKLCLQANHHSFSALAEVAKTCNPETLDLLSEVLSLPLQPTANAAKSHAPTDRQPTHSPALP